MGLGTTGQSLISNGTGVKPSWQSVGVNQTDDFNFTGTYFGVKNLNASSTVANPLILNTVSYDLPSLDGASSTSLWTDGNGSLTWNEPNPKVLFADGATHSTSETSTTTIVSYTIVAGEMSLSSSLLVNVFADNVGANNFKDTGIQIGDGSSTSTVAFSRNQHKGGSLELKLMNRGSFSDQRIIGLGYSSTVDLGVATKSADITYMASETSVDTANQWYIDIVGKVINASDSLIIRGVTITETTTP